MAEVNLSQETLEEFHAGMRAILAATYEIGTYAALITGILLAKTVLGYNTDWLAFGAAMGACVRLSLVARAFGGWKPV
jgi:hypothetical protein